MANKEENMIQISQESYKINLASKETNTLQGDGVAIYGEPIPVHRIILCNHLRKVASGWK